MYSPPVAVVATFCCALAACHVPSTTRTAGSPAPLPRVSAAESPGEIRRVVLAHEDVAELPGWELRLILIEYPPAAEAKPHVHPAPGVGYVIEGTFESAFGDAPVTVKHAGDTFVDLANEPHRVFRNPDPARWLRFLVAGTFRKGAPLFLPLPR